MLEVRSFCLYRRRTEPKCFVPDPSFFPPYHQRLKPYIFSAAEVGKLLSAAAHLKRNPASPLRPELTRLAIVLLFTTGLRRGELLKLTLGDYDRQEATLHIRETKFYNPVCFRSTARSRMRSSVICASESGGGFLCPRTHH